MNGYPIDIRRADGTKPEDPEECADLLRRSLERQFATPFTVTRVGTTPDGCPTFHVARRRPDYQTR